MTVSPIEAKYYFCGHCKSFLSYVEIEWLFSH